MGNLKKIAYNCRKATLLIEKRQLSTLSIREKLELKIHLTGCSICRLYERQSVLINRQVKNLFTNTNQHPQVLDDDYKNSLQEQIDQHLR
ncbi:MAG: hypothetical protein EOO05_13635 [Chitinophagaceae bacterium]|nr:MAG: hypothetical protein EOO05_13635 [Chitinophagaceae bacterium]